MGAMPAEFFESEEEFELWDGELVVKGVPAGWHEAVRLAVGAQLLAQCPDLSIRVSSAVGDESTAPRSDGSVLDTRVDPAITVVWIEVFSSADLRRGDARLVGERRKRFLFSQGVRSIWVFIESMGAITLNVHLPDRPVLTFGAPAQAELEVLHSQGRQAVVIDLGQLQRVADLAGDT